MSFEDSPKIEKSPKESKVVVAEKFQDFIPEEFRDNPFEYIKNFGVKIKSGEVEYKEDGLTVREDPTAVLDLPVWQDSSGEYLHSVVKKINTEKSQIAKSGDPFYEYEIIKIVSELGFPSPEPIAKIQQGDEYAFVMEKVEGYRLVGSDLEELKNKLTTEQIAILKPQAEKKMYDIQERLAEIGIHRKVKLTDMIIDVDFLDKENPKIIEVTPIDWERTKIDEEKLSAARRQKQNSLDSVEEGKKLETENLQVISPEQVQEISKFCRDTILGWAKLNPDYIFVGDASMNAMSIALKKAYKSAFPERKVKFYRLAPRELIRANLPTTDTFFEYRYPPSPPTTQKKMEDEKLYLTKKWIEEFDQNVIKKEGKENLKNKKALFFDDAANRSFEEPYLTAPGEEVGSLGRRTTADAATKVLQSVFDNVWLHIKALPYGFSGHYITGGKFKGPRHDEGRKSAEDFLNDLKKIALNSVKNIEEEITKMKEENEQK